MFFKRSRSRGLDQLGWRVGDITLEIDARLETAPRVRVMELGCGHGLALMELGLRYGDRVEMHGVNMTPEDGDAASMRAFAVKRGLCAEEESLNLRLPKIRFFDACGPWPLPDASFDVVYSQHAFLWIHDKVKALEEIHRVLKPGGVARIDAQMKRGGSVQKNSIIIRDGERTIPFGEYARSFANLRPHLSNRTILTRLRRKLFRLTGWPREAIRRRSYLEMTKGESLDLGLEFVESRLFSDLYPGRKGCQSVYHIKAKDPKLS